MSVESEILRIQHNIANAYAAVAERGGEVPLQPISANLATAVASIPTSGSAGGVPIGAIVIWSGTADNIPTGWALCDGQDGRPDLRDKFVLGAGSTHSAGTTGGSEEVTLTVEQIPKHDHRVNIGKSGTTPYIATTGTNNNDTSASFKSGVAGGGQPHPNMPPYYTLCYIIKL